MPLQDNLKLLVNDLIEIRLNLSMNNLNSNKNGEFNSVQNIISAFIGDNPKDYSNRNTNEGLFLLDFLIDIVCNTDLTFCNNNFAYLAQRQRLCCILINLRKLLCQLRCFDFENIKCDLLSKLLCLLLQIIEEIISVVLDLIALEALCAADKFECRNETFDCILCNLVKNINNLEMLINEISCLVLEIASQQIIICTSCTTSVCSTKHKNFCDCDYHKCSCNKKHSWRNYNKQD